GGGSLVYANTLPVPTSKFFQSKSWSGLADWEAELKPFYTTALTMLGATTNPKLQVGDLALKQLGAEIGKTDSFIPAEVAVYFGQPEVTEADPYFAGDGLERTGCRFCGGCMTGCRHNSKNTLDKNYLYLATQKGAVIQPESEVFDVEPLPACNGGGYRVKWQDPTGFFFQRHGEVTTKGVIFSGGVLGTIKLLLELQKTSLSKLSSKLGSGIRTNSESLTFSTSLQPNPDFAKGVAIGSILETDQNSHLEIVRYGAGSGFWRTSSVPLVSGSNIFIRLTKILLDYALHPIQNLKVLFVKDWAKATHVLLFMQTLDSTLSFSKGFFGRMATTVEKGQAPTAFMEEAFALNAKFSKLTGAKPMAFLAESIFGIPNTAHILGGAVMGENSAEGVIDKNNKVFGYEDMLICDGSMISANIGVNPSLTITALCERAMSKVPAKISTN
ncbi:MAG: GMC oxidoreductase, partial [SAR324 cluster bacterium]|nr:GMC oxidoreductase [SAR324 cluster bacterium]